tara:strand:- start:520 stop:945 length:426 start_codon:yes stop_codon:yes gene_type:complete
LIWFAGVASLLATTGLVLSNVPDPAIIELSWIYRRWIFLFADNLWWIGPSLFLIQAGVDFLKGIRKKAILPTIVASSIPVLWMIFQGVFYVELDRAFHLLNAAQNLDLRDPRFWLLTSFICCLPMLLNGIAIKWMRKLRDS